MSTGNKTAFSLVELLVVIAIISLLMGLLMPALTISRLQSRRILCKSNIRQLLLANTGYAAQNDGSYVPAALDILNSNRSRWHGVRDDTESPFDAAKGPLAPYLDDGRVNRCPQKVNFVEINPRDNHYEKGAGGYGYNMIYLGSRIWQAYEDQNCRITAKDFHLAEPARTLMFADAAMVDFYQNGTAYFEYSFAEPRYFVINGEIDTIWDPLPSIHFRHRSHANIGWADGHVDSRKIADYSGPNPLIIKAARLNLGWFEPLDNSMFDLE
jgi:prepilin-type N-terminal cleavage/methylation domain-containing protein/prepilin-type processing-associated H-X9-DG protein